jgi:RimJ/RimL family protein N-acetyltransferase
MVELFDDPDIALRTPLPTPFTADDARDRLTRSALSDRLMLAVTTDGERPLGEVLLTASGELGYMLGQPFRGQGLAARALALLRDYAHQEVGLAVLQLRIEPDNRTSAAVAERAGFRLSTPAAEVIEHKGRRTVLDVWQHVS